MPREQPHPSPKGSRGNETTPVFLTPEAVRTIEKERRAEREAREFQELVDRVKELEHQHNLNPPILDEAGEQQIEEQKRELIRRIAEKYELGTLYAETENPRNRFKIETAPNKGLLITCHLVNPHSIPEEDRTLRSSVEGKIGIRPDGTYVEWARYTSPDYASDIEELFYDSKTGEEMVYTIPVSKEEVDPIEKEKRGEIRAQFGQEWHGDLNWLEENDWLEENRL